MKKTKTVILICFLLSLSIIFTSCASKHKVEKLYSELKPFAKLNEIVMMDKNKIFVNGNSFYLDYNEDSHYIPCYASQDKIYYVESIGKKYFYKSVDFNGENIQEIKEVNGYLDMSDDGKLFSHEDGNYYFYDKDTLELNATISEDNEEALYNVTGGYKISWIENRQGFIVDDGNTSFEIRCEDVYNAENVGDIIKNYELKASKCFYFNGNIYFGVVTSIGVWYTLFMCFKYENQKLIFVDSCIFDVDSVSVCNFVND